MKFPFGGGKERGGSPEPRQVPEVPRLGLSGKMGEVNDPDQSLVGFYRNVPTAEARVQLARQFGSDPERVDRICARLDAARQPKAGELPGNSAQG